MSDSELNTDLPTSDEGEHGDAAPPSGIEIPEILVSENNEEFSQEVTEQLLMLQGESTWVGQLPRPDRLREYEKIYPGAARLIIEHMAAPNKLMADSIAIDDKSTDEYWKWMNRQEDRFVEESRSDRETRDRSSAKSFVYLYAILALFIVTIFAPLDTSVQITSMIVLGGLALGPSLVSSLRGRHSDNEREVMKSVPEMARGSASIARGASKEDPTKESEENL